MRTIKFEKKTLAAIIVAVLALSLFVGIASAPGRNDPFTNILEIIIGTDAKVDDIQADIDQIQADLEETTQLLGSYSGSWASTSVGGGVVETAEITTDKPAVFTVTVSVTGYVDAGDVVWLAQSVNQGAWSTSVGSEITYPDENCKTYTVAGYGVGLTYYDYVAANMNIRFCIVVEGEAGTVVSVGA